MLHQKCAKLKNNMTKKIWNYVTFCVLITTVNALNCRTDGGPKEKELKAIYMRCLKKQDGKNSNDSRGNSRERKEDRWSNQRSNNRDDRYGSSQGLNSRDDRFGNRNNPFENKDFSFSRDEDFESNTDYNKRNNNKGRTDFGNDHSGRNNNNNNRNNYNDDNMQTRYGHDEWNNGRNSWPGRRENSRDSGREMNYMNGRKRSNDMNDQDDMRNTDFDTTRYSDYSQSFPPRRYKRDKTNSGHRSQYNPNSRRMDSRDFRREDNNNTADNNSSRHTEDNKACALHCFLEELEMTGDNDMPDRHLVSRVITKDVRDEDLREFLQESVEDCFQILYNEHTDDKCEFSRDLMTCLSEKGRANCDDWKEDMRFTMQQHS